MQSSNPINQRRELSIHGPLDLGKLAVYRKLKSQVAAARDRFYKIHAQTLRVASQYLDELPEADTVIRLRREIRMASRGTPETIATDAITSAGYVSFGTEQLYNAQAHLVKKAYRMLAPLVHPDRCGGDTTLFQLVNAAYHLRDLTYLQELYIQLVKDDLWYRASDEAIQYLRQEIERPVVSLRLLQGQPEFEIARLHLTGKHQLARLVAKSRIIILIGTLQNELSYLLTKTLPSEIKDHHGYPKESEDDGSGTSPQEGE